MEPLFWEAGQLDGASLEQLIELGARIGLARGYALCRCTTTPKQPPPSVPQLLLGCGKDEGGMARDLNWYPSVEQGPRTNEDLVRCMREKSVQIPTLEAELRCELRRYQWDGRAWLDLCSIPDAPGDSSAWPIAAVDTCPNVEQLSQVIEECRSVGYCADGQRVSPGRCSGSRECPDSSDERGCFDFIGRDMLQCGGEITYAERVCDSLLCGFDTTPPLCSEALRDRFLCTDGSDVSTTVVCDRTPDCADETDELYCLR